MTPPSPPQSEDHSEPASAWEVLADPTRRRLVDLLLTDGEASATRLAAQVSITRQAVLKQLTVLERAGLVSRRREGREIRFQVSEDRLAEAAARMARLATQWENRLQGLKAVAERMHAQSATRDPVLPPDRGHPPEEGH